MTKYVMTLTDLDEATAVNKYLYAMVLFIVMRWLCTYLMKKFMPARLMTVIAFIGILVTFGTIYLPASSSIVCLMIISGCMSLMFPTIYGIALRGLFTAVASSKSVKVITYLVIQVHTAICIPT